MMESLDGMVGIYCEVKGVRSEWHRMREVSPKATCLATSCPRVDCFDRLYCICDAATTVNRSKY
jgi:hypothetical protein